MGPEVAEPDARALWMLEQDGGVYYLSLSDNSCSVKPNMLTLPHFWNISQGLSDIRRKIKIWN